MVSTLADDVRFAFRSFRRTPGISAAAATTLALGIGLTTAVCSVFQSVLLRQLPFREPDRVVSVTQESSDPRGRVSAVLLHEWQQRATSVESFAGYDDSQLLWHDRGQTEVLRGMRVTTGFFRTVRVGMALGRDLEGTDDPSKGDAIILTHPLWVRRFGGDPAVVGRTLDTDGGPRRVIGVLPEGFHGLRMSNPSEIPQYFAPLSRERTDPVSCAGCTLRLLGRLSSGATPDGARVQLAAIARDAATRDRDVRADAQVYVVPLLDRLVGPIRNALWLLLYAVLCVLLIACANIASLQLVRTTARAGEFATRTALGATRARLASQLLVENVLLAAAGGAAGIALGRVGTSVLAAWAPAETPRVDEIHMDLRVLLFACALSLATGVLFGLAPLATSGRVDITWVLRRTTRTGGHSGGHRLRSALATADLTLAFALVVIAGLLGRSLGNLQALDAGFDPHDVLTLTPVATAGGPARTDDGRLAYYQTLMERVVLVPGVSAVGMVSNVPLSNIEPVRAITDLDDTSGGDRVRTSSSSAVDISTRCGFRWSRDVPSMSLMMRKRRRPCSSAPRSRRGTSPRQTRCGTACDWIPASRGVQSSALWATSATASWTNGLETRSTFRNRPSRGITRGSSRGQAVIHGCFSAPSSLPSARSIRARASSTCSRWTSTSHRRSRHGGFR